MKAVLMYSGAKNRLAEWICDHMPEHKVYLELFAGSIGVLLNKDRSYIETVNDLDTDIVNLLMILRDYPEEFKRAIELTPYARDEYKNAYMETDNPIEKARRYYIRCWQGFGNSQLYNNGFKTGQQSRSPNPAKSWSELPEVIIQAAGRLKGVQIENLPALELIKRYDTEDVFMYLDPPYLQGIRKSHLYKHEMTNNEHEELLTVLTKHPGKILISGYDNDMYNKILKDWYKVHKSTTAEQGLKRTETLWMNYNPSRQMTLKDFEVMP